ncbi:cysteine hydrolase family protein [Pseudomonas sp. PA1(2017)]|uniref:cysteine hydrolase family protein n=1 Tax=Pseudomonas sp. PA1(2017) TaxID=1932113 RepID=UPI002115378D|nr:cysteine hydrolase family protein [Pseudomonas sp. PA1(2017)]
MQCLKALIVIDVQEGLFGPEPKPAFSSDVIARINKLTQRARLHDVPVILVQHEATTGEYFTYGSAAWQLASGLVTDERDSFVRKTTPDSFLRTDLDALLKQAGVSQIVVCGYATEFCVDTTVRSAAGLGYDVIMVSDAHTTHDKPHARAAEIITHHTATLANIRSFGVQISAQESAAVVF